MSPGVAIQVAQGLGVLAGAWAIKSMIDAEDEKPPMAGGFRCSTCNGSRRVPCLCTKWSDNDVGCGTCSGTGMMRCSSCGGSGTGRPIPVQIRASSIPGGGGGGNQRSWMNESVSKISSSSSRLAFSSLSLSLSLFSLISRTVWKRFAENLFDLIGRETHGAVCNCQHPCKISILWAGFATLKTGIVLLHGVCSAWQSHQANA
jgi:hypothetical protein